jgi:endonuclease/exonuclease/phosphatase family metal-dependent hydrolase
MLGLDRIYAAGRAEIRSFKAVYTRATRAASDHLPVRAEVMLLAPAGGREPGLLD